MNTPRLYHDVETCVSDVIARVGQRIVLGIPLGLGKPNQLVNAFFNRAKADASLQLQILTALSLEKPTGASDLERRFLEPLVARVFGNYPDLAYLTALRQGEMPANIQLTEFYFKPGAFLNSPVQQQNYICCNYTDVARIFIEHGTNVIAQMVSQRQIGDPLYYSLSSNTDVTLDLLPLIEEQRRQGRTLLCLAQINNQLPFMYRDALIEPARFDMVVDNADYEFTLFGPPNRAVSDTDYLIGLHASSLIRDGGTLQIGIGSLGDAIAYACLLRQQHNEAYRQLLGELGTAVHSAELIEKVGGLDPFQQGLYGSSEMFVNGFWQLYRSGILKRRVYDHAPLQRLLNTGRISETVTPAMLEQLLTEGVIQPRLTPGDFEFLQRFGIFREQLRYTDGILQLADGSHLPADLESHGEVIIQSCLGERLKNGIVMHGGFFLGPQSLYQGLRELSEQERQPFCMTGVSYVNQLYGDETLKSLQRQQARFINTTLVMTLTGAAASDGLDNGKVISGVGGQYNFVAMANALPGARSILILRSTRRKGSTVSSNIVWNYGHTTIPRHLRDIVVTEYGIADLRGKADKDVIAALLNIADSRFQEELLETAKRAGKIPGDYQIPAEFSNNTLERLVAVLDDYKQGEFFPSFPFGTDFTGEEIILGKILRKIKATITSASGLLRSLFKAFENYDVPEAAIPYLARLQLAEPDNFKDQVMQKLIIAELFSEGYISPEK
jgi:acyl-CoA hydrolase